MADRYWVLGGSEVFSDTDNWSLVSGGASGASVPGAEDTAHFDANSGEGGSCEITSAVLCHIDTTGILPGFEIEVYAGGSLSLHEDLVGLFGLLVEGGSLTTNNYNITVTGWFDAEPDSTIYLGTSVLTIEGTISQLPCFYIDPDVTLFDGDEATVIMNGAYTDADIIGYFFCEYEVGTLEVSLPLGGLGFGISGGATIGNLSITGDGAVFFNFPFENICTITNTLLLEGDTPGGLDLNGFYENPVWTISKASGTVTVVNCTITNSHSTGGATFNAFTTEGNVDGGGNTGWNFEGVTLVSIAVTPATAKKDVGETQQFVATATYSDESTADITSSVIWSTSDETIATIDANGLATAVGMGEVTIMADDGEVIPV